jgi:hypothetical protein
VLLGIVPQTTDLGVGLSPPVLAAMPALVDRVCKEAERLGFPLEMKARDAADATSREGGPAGRGSLHLLQPAG